VGLEAAVESHLAKQIQDEFGIECKFSSEGPRLSLNDDIKVVLFQAVRELMANVIKHANASTLEVSIINSKDELKVIVEDDGVGFDATRTSQQAAGESGFGLFNIRERLEYLGGNLEIESGRKKGACIIMSIPLKADAVA
jgi:signal transduction histidine kinase